MSRRRRDTALLPMLLIGICAALGWKIYDDWRVASADAAAAPVATAPMAAPEAPVAETDLALVLPPPERFAVIVERPLFSRTRRPAPPAPPQAQAPEEMMPGATPAPQLEPTEVEAPLTVNFTLVGIVIVGKDRYALVERHADGQVIEVPNGGEISGWSAVLIEAERAVFRQGEVEEELVLKYATPVPSERIPPRPRPAAQQQVMDEESEKPPIMSEQQPPETEAPPTVSYPTQ